MGNILKMFKMQQFENFNEALLIFAGNLIITILILITARILVVLGCTCIHGLMTRSRKIKRAGKTNFSNFETMLKTIYKYFVYIIAILTIITNVFHLIEPTSIVATVGIGGIALSFGAQSLVKDIISGFFILLEKQMEVGDFVFIEDISGTVKEIDLRCVKIETYKGEIVYIPYGEIRKLINKSKVQSSVLVDIPVTYKQDIDPLMKIVNKIVVEYYHKDLESPLQTLLPVSLDEKTYMIRIYGKCKACADWGIERELRMLIVEKANKAKIKLGFSIDGIQK